MLISKAAVILVLDEANERVVSLSQIIADFVKQGGRDMEQIARLQDGLKKEIKQVNELKKVLDAMNDGARYQIIKVGVKDAKKPSKQEHVDQAVSSSAKRVTNWRAAAKENLDAARFRDASKMTEREFVAWPHKK